MAELKLTRDIRIPIGKFGNVNSSISITLDNLNEEEFNRKFLLAEKWLDFAQALEIESLLSEGNDAAEDPVAYHAGLEGRVDDFKSKLKIVAEKLFDKKE